MNKSVQCIMHYFVHSHPINFKLCVIIIKTNTDGQMYAHTWQLTVSFMCTFKGDLTFELATTFSVGSSFFGAVYI